MSNRNHKLSHDIFIFIHFVTSFIILTVSEDAGETGYIQIYYVRVGIVYYDIFI